MRGGVDASYWGPRVDELLRFGEARIASAVGSMWPFGTARVAGLVPSITNVVALVEVAGSVGAVAKYGFLGMSLVSILRGRAGSWPEVLAAQQRYMAEATATAGEARQLQLLARIGVPASTLVGYRDGALVCERLVGETLADRLVTEPQHSAGLLEGAWEAVRPLHLPAGPGLTPGRSVLVPRGSIPATFDRKLTGEGADRFIASLGAGWLDVAERGEVCSWVARAVDGLGQLRSGREGGPGQGESGVVFGDLKPEHVIYDHGGGPVFCDPMLTRAGSVADAAKLVSRAVLAVHATATPARSAAGVADGIGRFVEARLRERPVGEQPGWLRDLLVLWAMDALNIATTYLSAPVDLPVAGPLAAVGRWAPRMARLAGVLGEHLAFSEAPVVLEAAADTVRACA